MGKLGWKDLVVLRRSFPLVLVLICFSISSFSYAQATSLSEPRETTWEKIKDHQDIVVYEGNILKDGIVPLKGHVVINHPIDKVITVMADTQGKKNWLPSIKKIKIIDQPDEYNKAEFFHIDMPFIVSDRITVLESHATVSNDKNEIIVKVFSSKKYLEKQKQDGFVKAKMPFGEVRLRSIENGTKTIVAGIFYTSPEGMIPNWIVRRFTRKLVYKSLVKLREIVGQDLYDSKSIQKYTSLISNYNKNNRSISSSPE